MHYEGNIIRPPSEANSILLQATVGCSRNKCTFCGTYMGERFRIKPDSIIMEDIAFAATYCKNQRRVFLCDGDALIIPQKRLLNILAEIVGFATVSDPSSIANPDIDSIAGCMRAALEDAGITPENIDYINAHATATLQGDIAESEAIYQLFGDNVPLSSLKGHLGHAMAASGSLELAAVVEMLNRECLVPTLNLDNVDEACANIRHVRTLSTAKIQTAIKNNFALGGVNSSLIMRRYHND